MRRVAPLTFAFLALIVTLTLGQAGRARAQETAAPQAPAADSYEPDDAPEGAALIQPTELQHRTLSPVGDVDWAKLTIETGLWSADFGASGANPGAVTLSLYDDALTLIESVTANASPEIDRRCALDPPMTTRRFAR